MSVFTPLPAQDNKGATAGAAASPGSPSAPASSTPAPSSTSAPGAPASSIAAPARPAKTIDEERLDILRFGTETEIANLIQILKNEKVTNLDSELIEIAKKTRNRNILTGIFNFFGDMERKGLEERAIRAIRERDDEANDTVLAAVDYLGRVNAAEARMDLEELINSGESRFINNAIRALGRVVKKEEGGSADETALFLLDYYNNRSPADTNRRDIIVALGETGSKESVSFLVSLIKNADERAVLRIAALEAVSKIGDSDALDAVIEAVSSPDPNVRSSAIAALGPFQGEAAESAILDGFRDSFWRTRFGAAQAAGKRKMTSAIPFLRFRAEKDDVPSVRDEAIKALGEINNSESEDILNALFSERKNSDRVRLVAAEMLVKNKAGNYSSRVIAEMEYAKEKRMTPLYNGFVRILSTAKSPNFEDFAKRLLVNGDVIEKSLGLDLVLNNEFRSLAAELRALLDEKKNNASIVRKARVTLEKLGLDAEAAAPAAAPASTTSGTAAPANASPGAGN